MAHCDSIQISSNVLCNDFVVLHMMPYQMCWLYLLLVLLFHVSKNVPPSARSNDTKPILIVLAEKSTENVSNQKILYFPTSPHNMANFGPLTAEIGSGVWSTPANFNGFRFLGALLHGTLVMGVSQTAALNRGRHLYSATGFHAMGVRKSGSPIELAYRLCNRPALPC